ncbi:MAG: asparagine synthetase B [Nanoarchaeota archaeon]|nr:asparagine synthetase B [Nanoarchaeota archaeon]
MCGIIASPEKEVVQKGLDMLLPRGRDNQHTKETEHFVFGHALHAIVGHVPQPITHQGTLVFNGEIYNWKEITAQQGISAQNDADLLCQLLDKESVSLVLERLDGVYAFVYQKEEMIIATRDLLGVKPLYFTREGSFASENKALDFKGEEVDPRSIIYFDLQKRELFTQEKNFYTLQVKEQEGEQASEVFAELFVKAIQKRIPDQHIKVGVLLSGGVDSTMIAKVCKELECEVTCYTATLDNPEGDDPHDLLASQQVAKRYGFDHKIITATKEEIPQLAKEVSSQIESTDAVKVAVGIPFYLCAKEAAKDGCKVLFSGLGAEEIMAGYQRHKQSTDINEECLSGLLQLHERDLYRDDILTIRQGVELRLPFLDRELIEFSLTIPSDLKITPNHQKYLLRLAAVRIGIEETDAFRPKKAAQYGSQFDRALKKVAKAKGFQTRKEFLESL